MKLSQWHSGKVKPVHIGVYESDDCKGGYGGAWFRLWDGEKWCHGSFKKSIAANCNVHSPYQNWPWRGIVK